jgi:hypothetical protein
LNQKLDADRDSVANDTYAGSEAGSSDYAYNMKQWLLSAETAFEEVATEDPLESLKPETDEELDTEEQMLTADAIIKPDHKKNLHLQAVGGVSEFYPLQTGWKLDQVVPLITIPETQGAVANPLDYPSTRTDGPTVSSTSIDSITAQATVQSAKDQPDISSASLRPLFRKLSFILEDEATSFGSSISHATFSEPTSLPTERRSGAIVIPVLDIAESPTKTVASFSAVTVSSTLTAEQDGRSSDAVPGSSHGTPRSPVEKSVTRILVAAKELLENLVRWSRQQASDEAVSNNYVRLGYECNSACRMFKWMDIDTSALSPVPELLRVVLESTLSQEASPESLERYLPRIRDIVKNFLQGPKRMQSVAAQSGKQPNASSTDNDLEKENTSPKLSNNPVRPEIKVGDIVVAIRQCLFFSTYPRAKH